MLLPERWRREVTRGGAINETKHTSGSVVVGEVTTLQHELRDHAVKDAALVAVALLSRAESTEVLGGAGHIGVELESDALGGGFANLDIEENFLQGGECELRDGCDRGWHDHGGGGIRAAQCRGGLTGKAICLFGSGTVTKLNKATHALNWNNIPACRSQRQRLPAALTRVLLLLRPRW
jgi:hypothetical protein